MFRNQPGLPGWEMLKAIGNQCCFQAVGFPEIIVVVLAEGDDFICVPHHHFFRKMENFVPDPLEFAPFPVDSVNRHHNFLFAEGRQEQKAGVAQGMEVEHIVAAPQPPQGCQEGGHQGIRCLFIDGKNLFEPNALIALLGFYPLFPPDINGYVLSPFHQLLRKPAHHHINSALTGGNPLRANHRDFHGKVSPEFPSLIFGDTNRFSFYSTISLPERQANLSPNRRLSNISVAFCLKSGYNASIIGFIWVLPILE